MKKSKSYRDKLSLLKKLKNLRLNDNNIVIIGNINSKNNIYLRDF